MFITISFVDTVLSIYISLVMLMSLMLTMAIHLFDPYLFDSNTCQILLINNFFHFNQCRQTINRD